jgi:DNA modification methylase
MLINANALSIPLADKCVQLVVTSPPYYGQRDYKTDGQLGLEPTPEQYVENLVQVFRELWRVLKDDGIAYLNLGDSYAGSGCGTNDYRTEKSRSINKSDVMFSKAPPQQKLKQYGYKPKDLLMIPAIVAFALRNDGWYLRDDIIWAKGYSGNMRGGSVMPESVKDRCTKAYEHIFMLTKSPKYYYDYNAVLEPIKPESIERSNYGWDCDRPSTKNANTNGNGIHVSKMGNRFANPNGGNPRNVWLINPKPFKGAHYAVFPPELVRLPILAGSRAGDIVLDPFCGSGTTLMVAKELGREAIGLDLSFTYLHDIAEPRLGVLC